MLPGIPGSAMCVQRFDDSLNSAIHITYRISLRSSSLREPRYPSTRVVCITSLLRTTQPSTSPKASRDATTVEGSDAQASNRLRLETQTTHGCEAQFNELNRTQCPRLDRPEAAKPRAERERRLGAATRPRARTTAQERPAARRPPKTTTRPPSSHGCGWKDR